MLLGQSGIGEEGSCAYSQLSESGGQTMVLRSRHEARSGMRLKLIALRDEWIQEDQCKIKMFREVGGRTTFANARTANDA